MKKIVATSSQQQPLATLRMGDLSYLFFNMGYPFYNMGFPFLPMQNPFLNMEYPSSQSPANNGWSVVPYGGMLPHVAFPYVQRVLSPYFNSAMGYVSSMVAYRPNIAPIYRAFDALRVGIEQKTQDIYLRSQLNDFAARLVYVLQDKNDILEKVRLGCSIEVLRDRVEKFERDLTILFRISDRMLDAFPDCDLSKLTLCHELNKKWDEFEGEIKSMAANFIDALNIVTWSAKILLYHDLIRLIEHKEDHALNGFIELFSEQALKECPYLKKGTINFFVQRLCESGHSHEDILSTVLGNDALVQMQKRSYFSDRGFPFFIDTMVHALQIYVSYKSSEESDGFSDEKNAVLREKRHHAQVAANTLLKRVMPEFNMEQIQLENEGGDGCDFTYYIILLLRESELKIVEDNVKTYHDDRLWLLLLGLYDRTEFEEAWLAQEMANSFFENYNSNQILIGRTSNEKCKSLSIKLKNISDSKLLFSFLASLNKKIERHENLHLVENHRFGASLRDIRDNVSHFLTSNLDYRLVNSATEKQIVTEITEQERLRFQRELIESETRDLERQEKRLQKLQNKKKHKKDSSKARPFNAVSTSVSDMPLKREEATSKSASEIKFQEMQKRVSKIRKDQEGIKKTLEEFLAFQNESKRDSSCKMSASMCKVVELEIINLKVTLSTNPKEIFELARAGKELLAETPEGKEEGDLRVGFETTYESALQKLEQIKSKHDSILEKIKLRLDEQEVVLRQRKEEFDAFNRTQHKKFQGLSPQKKKEKLRKIKDLTQTTYTQKLKLALLEQQHKNDYLTMRLIEARRNCHHLEQLMFDLK